MIVKTLFFKEMARNKMFWLKVVLLLFIILYLLPKLLTIFWNAIVPTPDIHDQKLMENPLRVFLEIYGKN